MPGFTGFGGNSIGSDSQFGNMGSNDPYGSGNTGGDFGHNGNGQSSSGGTSGNQNVSVTVMKPGDFYETPWGRVIINAQGQPTMNGVVMTYENSTLATYGSGAFRVLNSLLKNPASPSGGNNGKSTTQATVERNLMVQSGALPSGYWLSNGKVMTQVRVERTINGGGKGNDRTTYVTVEREVPAFTAIYNEGVKIRQEAAIRAQAEAAARARAEEEARALASGKSKAEIDAGQKVKTAQATVNTAQSNVNSVSGSVKSANQVIAQKQSEMKVLNSTLTSAQARFKETVKFVNDPIQSHIHFSVVAGIKNTQSQIASKQKEINTAVANRDSLNEKLRQANVALQNAKNQKAAADAALSAATAQRIKAEADAKAALQAAEKARIAAEQEKVRQARQAAANKLSSVGIQSVRGIPAAAAPAAIPLTWAVAGRGGISLGSDVVASVWSQITAGLAELRAIATASLAGPVAVTVAWLLYSREVGAGSDLVPGRDISSLMPADMLSLPGLTELNNAADRKTGVSMPVRGRMILHADGKLETQLVRTPVAGVVPVVRAALDQATGYWGYALPVVAGAPGQTILISPADAPGVGGPLGLTGPVPVPEYVLHTGNQDVGYEGVTTTTTPVFGEPDFRDFILIFPAESGLKPLYVMQNSPYGEATEKGKHSGRYYNPDKAGGPVQNLDWRNVVIDNAGIDKVKLHTGRFGESAANKVMIERLDKIQNGQLQVTDTDKRFYTHELRELERYRALGIPDNVDPDDEGVTWNNTHTATLEDYKINEKTDPLYTKDAEEAEYKAELKK